MLIALDDAITIIRSYSLLLNLSDKKLCNEHIKYSSTVLSAFVNEKVQFLYNGLILIVGKI